MLGRRQTIAGVVPDVARKMTVWLVAAAVELVVEARQKRGEEEKWKQRK
jgi:hypothetical protein